MLSAKAAKYGVRLTLALILGLALVSFVPIPAQAQVPIIDLVLGGEGATSWNIVNIKPGDSGIKVVKLYNASRRNGSVTIWISDIISSEGTNPESEAGDTAEPGELLDYLVFNLSCSRLSTNLSLPATIDNLPQSASAPYYIKISPLYALQSITLVWEWEFPEMGEPQNEAQGDSLSFTINYLLEELLPEGGGGGEGGWHGSPPEPPPGKLIIGLAYEFQPSCTFDPPIKLILHYEPQGLGDGIDDKDLVIAYWDNGSQEWVVLPSVVDTVAEIVTVQLSRSSTFAMLVAAPAAPPISAQEPTVPPAPETAPAPALSTGIWLGIGVGVAVLLGFIVWLIKGRHTGQVAT